MIGAGAQARAAQRGIFCGANSAPRSGEQDFLVNFQLNTACDTMSQKNAMNAGQRQNLCYLFHASK
jgi:hypothetical protein